MSYREGKEETKKKETKKRNFEVQWSMLYRALYYGTDLYANRQATHIHVDTLQKNVVILKNENKKNCDVMCILILCN